MQSKTLAMALELLCGWRQRSRREEGVEGVAIWRLAGEHPAFTKPERVLDVQ